MSDKSANPHQEIQVVKKSWAKPMVIDLDEDMDAVQGSFGPNTDAGFSTS